MKKWFQDLIFILIFGSLGFFLVRRYVSISHVYVGSLQIQENAEEPLHFFALGDTGSGDENQYQVAHAMETRCKQISHLNGILLLGDLFYMRGVKSVQDPQWEEKILKPYGTSCLRKAQIFPIYGNHDYRGNKDAFVEYTKENARWKMPHRFYAVHFQKLVNFIAIDSNFADLCFRSESCVADFLNSELKKDFKWKVVLSHHPLSSSSKKGYTHNGETFFGSLFRFLSCDKADLWLSGHAHHLEHRKMTSCNTQLFISGGGGGELEDIDPTSPELKFGSSEFGFLELEVTQQSIKTRFFNKNAKEIYKETLTKSSRP